jgi:hypothetical protein
MNGAGKCGVVVEACQLSQLQAKDGGTPVNASRFLHDGLVAERDGRSSAQGQSRAVAVTFGHMLLVWHLSPAWTGAENISSKIRYTREFQSHLEKTIFYI